MDRGSIEAEGYNERNRSSVETLPRLFEEDSLPRGLDNVGVLDEDGAAFVERDACINRGVSTLETRRESLAI